MTSEPVYSFVFDRQSAAVAFAQTGKYDLVLGLLATLPPEPEWEGCLVYEGMTPLQEVRTVCIGMRGNAADQVQERLVEAFESRGVQIIEVYEGGPEVREPIAKVTDGTWKTAKK